MQLITYALAALAATSAVFTAPVPSEGTHLEKRDYFGTGTYVSIHRTTALPSSPLHAPM